MFRTYKDIQRKPVRCSKQNEKPCYKCEFCDEGWQSESEVYIHKQIHARQVRKLVKKKRPICLLCFTKQESHEDLIIHIKTNHLLTEATSKAVDREIFICDECDAIFFNKSMLALHLCIDHKATTKTNLKCPAECCLKRIKPKHYKYHILCHEMRSMTTCPICCFKAVDRTQFKSHLKTHPLPTYCYFCDSHITKEYYKHMDKHRNKALFDNSIKCKRFFVPIKNLKTVIRWKVGLQTNKGIMLPPIIKICVLCREICTRKEEMKQHIMDHNMPCLIKEESEEPQVNFYVCHCGQTFRSKIFLKQHTLKHKDLERAQEIITDQQSSIDLETSNQIIIDPQSNNDSETSCQIINDQQSNIDLETSQEIIIITD